MPEIRQEIGIEALYIILSRRILNLFLLHEQQRNLKLENEIENNSSNPFYFHI